MKKILIATDGSETARAAIDAGVELAVEDRAEIVFAHVTSVLEFAPELNGSEAPQRIPRAETFDPNGSGLERHTVYLSADEVLFVFEGHEVEWIVDGLVDEPFHWPLLAALDDWRPLLEGHPRIARPMFTWKREVLDGASSP